MPEKRNQPEDPCDQHLRIPSKWKCRVFIDTPFSRSEHLHKQFNNLTSQLESGHSIRIRASGYNDGEQLHVSLRKAKKNEINTYFSGPFECYFQRWVVEFEGKLLPPTSEEFPVYEVRAGEQKGPFYWSNNEVEFFWKQHLPKYLTPLISTYLMSLIISSSGSFSVSKIVWTMDGEFKTQIPAACSVVSEAVEFMRKNGVSFCSTLAPETVFNWVSKQNGVYSGYSDNPASKAVNYFTRLFQKDFREDELSDLIWAFAGVEAILVRAGRSSSGQLREKLNAVFSNNQPTSWILESIDRTYQHRSKLVHGNRQIRSSFRDDDDVDKRIDEEYHSTLFAVGLLLLLIQFLIENHKKSLDFETILKE